VVLIISFGPGSCAGKVGAYVEVSEGRVYVHIKYKTYSKRDVEKAVPKTTETRCRDSSL